MTVLGIAATLLLTALTVTTVVLWHAVDDVQGRLERQQDAASAAQRDAEAFDARLRSLEGEQATTFDPAAVAEIVTPSVFMIVAPLDDTSASLGTGVVIGKDGRKALVVTNFHVVEQRWRAGADDVLLQQGPREYDGEIVLVSPDDDLALVQVAADLPALDAASAPPQVGDEVMVVGAGAGLEGTVTTGVVSAVGRLYEGETWLQFSAQANPGDSGGPVVNADGEVAGIVTRKLVALEVEGVSFAIPVDRVCSALGIC
jgi:S1-C subfamily serine protease